MRAVLFCLSVLLSSQAQAALISWTIDSTQSFIRLNVPDQQVPVTEDTSLPAALRDYQTNGGSEENPILSGDPDEPLLWTDDGGRRNFVTGSLSSWYSEGSSIQFTSGTHNATAVQSGSFLPGTPGPASFAADVWLSGEVDPEELPGVYANLRLGHVRILDIQYDVNGTAGLTEGPTGTWSQTSGSLDLGTLAGATIDVDLIDLITDFGVALDPLLGTNVGGLMIENIGGLQRKLTIVVDLPVALELNNLPLTASITGQIVAFATVPEPASMGLVAAALAMGVFRRRRAIGY
ncbi:MAG: PEP-CTERM sorting domain-containing protein [Pirellulaceae bacterium]|nr:PEP-CTERM sorting domain-containing protein [Pirellulaceae bacterium]